MKRFKMSHRSTGMGYESQLVECRDGNLVDIAHVKELQEVIAKIGKIAGGKDNDAIARICELVKESTNKKGKQPAATKINQGAIS